jgi:hypothetical protein
MSEAIIAFLERHELLQIWLSGMFILGLLCVVSVGGLYTVVFITRLWSYSHSLGAILMFLIASLFAGLVWDAI